MLSSVKIVPDSFSKIVHYTYYLTRDLLDCTTQSPRIFREKNSWLTLFISILPSSHVLVHPLLPSHTPLLIMTPHPSEHNKLF